MTELKKCTCCQKEYPKTSEHFAVTCRRGKNYMEPKCRVCSREYNKNYRQKNAERLRANQRKWTQTPLGAYKSLKNSTRGHLVLITRKEFVEWYKFQERVCCYCGIKEEELQQLKDAYNNKTFRLSIDRIDSNKNYEKDNLALCCLRCNHIKGDFFTQSEMEEIGQKYIAKKWENARQH